MKDYQIMQLNHAYSKKIKALNKDFFKNKEVGLILFIEYLKYIRDCLVISTVENLDECNIIKTKITTLTTAIAEFDAYKASQNSTKKVFHWNNFCELVKLNMEEWLKANDSI